MMIEKGQEEIQTGDRFFAENLGIRLAVVIPEILSRLCLRCSYNSKEKLLEFLFCVYRSDHRSNYGGIKNLMERLLYSFSVHERLNLIPRLLDVPIIEHPNHVEESEFLNPFQFLMLGKELVKNRKYPVIPDEKIQILLEKALSEDANTRKWAITTLAQLHSLDMLIPDQLKRFAEALWSKKDCHEFPSQTGHYYFAFLNLPHPDSIEPVLLLKKYILNSRFPIQNDGINKGIGFGEREVRLCREIIESSLSLSWSEKEIISIFDRLVEWWDADKTFLMKKDDAFIQNEFKGRFTGFTDVLIKVVAPNFRRDTAVKKKETLLRLIHELPKYGLPSHRLESACLHLYPRRRKNLLDRIEKGLALTDREGVIDALGAILIILEKTELHSNKSFLSGVLNLLGQTILWRKEPGLVSVLNTCSILVKNHSSLITKKMVDRSNYGRMHNRI